MKTIVQTFFEIIGYLSSILGLYITIIQLKKKYYGQLSWYQIDDALSNLSNSIIERKYDPDVIIGIGKGGSVIAGMLSAKLGYIPIFHVDRQLIYRKDGTPEGMEIIYYADLNIKDKNVIIVNGESYTGSTLLKVKELLGKDEPKNILTAALIRMDRHNKNNLRIDYSPDFYGLTVEKSHILPWEKKGKKRESNF